MMQSEAHVKPVLKWGALGTVVLALLLGLRVLPLERVMQALTGWITGLGWWGPLLYGVIYVGATVLLVPGSVITIAAGALFGLWLGTLLASLASTTGAALAFLLARSLAREQVAKLAQRCPKFQAIDQAIGEGGWKVVALLRLSPAIPFNLQNYLYGLTPIGFWSYVLASWLAMLPGTFLYVYIGHPSGVAVGGTHTYTPVEWGMLGVGLLATVAVTIYLTRLARQKLREQTAVAESEE
jgi:uncharacterized membrane protein YdjX (TVP38/TMEM64 family)